jgi:uncharacterized damage-inducible protein DinB
MTAYFTRLFNYDCHTNLTLIDLLLSSGYTEGKPVELMAHMLAAQQIWLKRAKKLPAPGAPQWPDWPVTELKAIAVQNHQDYIDYLGGLKEADFAELITYTNTKGDQFANRVEDILTQVTNHGTHHRAQIGWLLKTAGL